MRGYSYLESRYKSGWVTRALKPILLVLALAIAVALITFLPPGADARQPGQGSGQGPGPDGVKQTSGGSSDPFYAEVFAPIKDDINIKVPYSSLKSWEAAKDETVDRYANIPDIQPSVERKSANIPRVMGIQNYDNPTAANGNINTKQSGPTYFYDRQIFEGWNFIDEYVTFGWGPISVPSPQEITIAHKNGLPVIATVMLGNSSGASQAQYVVDARDLISKDNGNFWAVDKLVQLADTFHFDGWFINLELSLDPAGAQDYSDFVTQLSKKMLKSGNRMIVVWYDTIDENGMKSYPGLTPGVAGLFFNPVMNGRFFADYRQIYDDKIDFTRTNAGTRASDAFMGVNWWEWCQSQTAVGEIQKLSDSNKAQTAGKQLPLGLWAIGFPTLGNNIKYDPQPVSARQIHEYAAGYWWNSDIVPAQKFDGKTDPDGKIPVNGQGKAMADYHQRTSVTTIPFTTSFNLGRGDRYFSNGKMVSDASWGNLVEQDILPNYLIQQDGVKVSFDFSDAFNGGTSLKVENGTARDFAGEAPIYLTGIDSTPRIGEARLTYKNSGAGTGDFYLKFSGGKYSTGQLPPTDGRWKEIAIDAVSGQTLLEMGISRIAAGSSVNLGKIQVVGEAHLEATKYADPGSVKPGGRITYTTAIANTSDTDAGGISFSDEIPNDTSVVPGSLRCSDTNARVISKGPVVLTGITVKAEDTVTVEFSVEVRDDKRPGTVVSNQGHLSYDGIELPTSNREHPGKGLPTLVTVEQAHLGSNEWLIAEGSTGGGFDTYILVQNPGSDRASVTVTFASEAGPVKPVNLSMAPWSRATIRMADYVPDCWQVSTLVQSDRPIAAERSTYWDRQLVGESDRPGSPAPWQMRSGHSDLGVPVEAGGSTRRGSNVNYFAEGATAGIFDTWILLYNANKTDATARVTFMTEKGEVKYRSVVVGANSRATVHLDEYIPDSYHVSTEVVSDKPLVAERSVYWDPDESSKQPWQMTGGHSTSGTTTPGTRWFLTEGSTGGGFETFLLLLNPNEKKVTAHLTFSDITGIIRTRLVEIPARSRITLKASDYAPDNFSVATQVLCSEPIVAERSTYWDKGASSQLNRMRDGHAGAGISTAGHTWLVPEGSTGGGFDSWILIANISPVATAAKVSFMGEGGKIKSADVTIPAKSRYSLHLNDYVPGRSGVSTLIESGGSLVVERAMYWDRNETAEPYEMMGGNSASGVQH
jgi:uncharacterized repeat protein (TIGR01451 family)